MNNSFYALNRILTAVSLSLLFLSSCKKLDNAYQGQGYGNPIDSGGGNIQTADYYEYYSITNSWLNSPGKLSVTGYGEVQQFVSGTFLLEKSGIYGDGSQTVKIEGSFRVKRVNDN